MKIRTHRGAEAHDRLEDPAFQGRWRALADRTPWPSTFQSPSFCLPWYRAYTDRFEPVLVSAEECTELLGLLPLAHDGERLVHAGDHQCEYRGWLSDPELVGDFLPAAIDRVAALHAEPAWRWDNLPPGAPAGWADELAGATRTTAEVPVMDVRDQEFMDGKSRGRLRSHRNHFKRRGLRYERVVDPDRARLVLDRLAIWCDLRQGAAHDVLPFGSDPHKLDFHRRLLEQGDAFWLSALWLDDDLLAAHLGPFDGRELAMGIQAYDPREGRRSPGAILMLEMARDLLEAGGERIDLTPGGDRWKERWASAHRRIESVELRAGRVASTLAETRRTIGQGARGLLRQLGGDPSRVRERLSVITGSGDPAPAEPRLGRLSRSAWTDARGGSVAELPPQPDADRFDRMLVDAAGGVEPAIGHALLSTASRCLAEDWRPWSLIEAGRLTALAWTQPSEGWVDLEYLDDVRCRRNQPDEDSVRLPEDSLLIRIDAPVSDRPRAIERLVRGILHELRPEGEIWLLADARLAKTTPLLAAATIGGNERTGSDSH